MSAPRYAQLAGQILSRRTDGDCVDPPSVEARNAAIAAIERALDSRLRTHWRIRWVGTCSAAAALVLGVVGISVRVERNHLPRVATIKSLDEGGIPASALQIVAHPQGSGVRLVGSTGASDLSDGWALGPGSRIVTPATGRATLAFSTGTVVALGEGADMTVVSQGATERLRLDQGAIDLHVAKQSAAQRFLVDTSDAEVEVRGTQFRVALVPPERDCGDGTWTRVVVTEGVVVVRHGGEETQVAAGSRWPSGCRHEAAMSLLPVTGDSPSGSRSLKPGPAAMPMQAGAASNLSDQNDLFAEAFAAKRQGDVWRAAGVFERLATRYPASPFAESAGVERMRLLRDVSPSKARMAAVQYLARYPSGYARAEAESIAVSSP